MIFGYAPHDDASKQYTLKIDFDGQTTLHVWAEGVTGEIGLTLNSACVERRPASGSPSYCGAIRLPRGVHVLEVGSDTEPTRVILSDEQIIDNAADFERAWMNRSDQPSFLKPDYTYTREDVEQLRRHGFIFWQPRDCQCAAVPSGVPLGGIGAGKVELTAEGLLTAFTGNNNQDAPVYRLPGSYFAVQVSRNGQKRARLLQTLAFGHELPPLAGARADLEFPFARIEAVDGSLPLGVTLEAFSPHIAGDTEHSALPCVFFEVKLTNPSDADVSARVLFSWENIINVGGSMQVTNQGERLLPLCYHTWNASYVWSDRRQNRARPLAGPGCGVLFGAAQDCRNPGSFGEHIIWTEDEQALCVPDRDIIADEFAFSRWFEQGCPGDFTATGASEFRAGALIARRDLAAHQTAVIRFMLCWYMPNMPDHLGRNPGVFYAGRFSSADAVLRSAAAQRDDFYTRSAEVNRLVQAADLPTWFRKRLLNDRFVADTATWFDREGLFSVNEGATGMAGCLGTLDQRTASQGYWTTFFPDLDACELDLFRQCQGEDGLCSHHLGFASIDLRPTIELQWPDLAAAYIIQVYHHFQRTGDLAFLKLHGPHVLRAIAWTLGMDDLDSAIPRLTAGRGTTYDNQQWEGLTAFAATMQIAALKTTAAIVRVLDGEPAAAAWDKLAEKAQTTRMTWLWKSPDHYFYNAVQIDPPAVDDSCFIAGLAGDWALERSGLESPLGPELLALASASIIGRTVFANGMTDQSARPETPAFMQYAVAYLGAAALYGGQAGPAWRLMAVNDKVLTTPPSSHFIQGLTYESDGAHLTSLPYYMTAPASWSFLEALAGLVFDAAAGYLGLAPAEGAARLPVFTTSSWFTMIRNEDRLILQPVRSLKACAIRTVAIAGRWQMAGRAGRFEKGRTLFAVDFDPGLTELVFSQASAASSQPPAGR